MPQLQPPQQLVRAAGAGGAGAFAPLTTQQRWGVDTFEIERWSPPPPPRFPRSAEGETRLKDASERVKTLVVHGAAAASELAKDGAAIAAPILKDGAVRGATLAKQATHEAAKALQTSAGFSAADVEMLGLGIGLVAGLCCLCCLRCVWVYYAQPSKLGTREARARRAMAAIASRSRRRRSHRAVPTDDYDDDDDDDYMYP